MVFFIALDVPDDIMSRHADEAVTVCQSYTGDGSDSGADNDGKFSRHRLVMIATCFSPYS